VPDFSSDSRERVPDRPPPGRGNDLVFESRDASGVQGPPPTADAYGGVAGGGSYEGTKEHCIDVDWPAACTWSARQYRRLSSRKRSMSRDEIGSWLHGAAGDGDVLVRIGRHRLEPVATYSAGYVAAVSDTLVVLNKVSDRIDLDGFELLRVGDITSVELDFSAREFYQKAFEVKGVARQPVRMISLDSLPDAIRTIDEQYPAIVLHRERVAPDEVAIGRVAALLRTGVKLRWLSPVAVWERDRTLYSYSSITRVEFDGEYENTLALVAGPTPDGGRHDGHGLDRDRSGSRLGPAVGGEPDPGEAPEARSTQDLQSPLHLAAQRVRLLDSRDPGSEG
jgi:hypothetical protein